MKAKAAWVSVGFVALFLCQSSFAGLKKIPSPSGNYCKDEVIEYMKGKFGDSARIISIEKFGSGRSWEYWTRTDLCSGYLVMDFASVEFSNCTTPQYISRTRFMERVWGYGDCKRILPKDDFPKYFETN